MRPEIREDDLKEYMLAICEDFFTDYKEQQKCSDCEVMSVVVSALSNTLAAMSVKMKDFQLWMK